MYKAATLITLAAISGAAFGGIVAIDDGLVKSSPDANDPLRGFGEADFIQGFAEMSSITLTSDISIQLGDGSFGILEAGTIVNSHMVYFDPIGNANLLTATDIDVEFDAEIIGLITDVNVMTATNDLLGLAELNYYYGSDQSYGANGAPDVETYSGSTLNLTLRSRTGDYLRVLTVGSNPVPTPGSLALLGAAGMISVRRRR